MVRAAGSALEMLVRQFSQPLACLRELVQNAIDAGSNQVEVSLTQEDQESVCLSVHDTGEGMNRQIIETQLTRLFASAKDGDLTKVGKFGIGFVSVFGLQPLAVVVDTGRDGESWRILFHADRTYELLRLPQRVEGTCVRIYLPNRKTSLEQKLMKVGQTLSFWCKHCRAEITLNGLSISRPFRLEAPFQVFHEQPGTRLVVAVTEQRDNFAGFYNQGLTLLEGVCSPIPFLSFKVDSRYFEHTLTRDNVIHNEDYQKALRLIHQAVETVYAPALFERLRAGGQEWSQLDSLRELGVELDEVPLFRDIEGVFQSLRDLRRAQVSHQPLADPLSAALHDPAQSRLVLFSGPGTVWLDQAGVPCPASSTLWGFCQLAEREPFDEIWRISEPFVHSLHLPPIQAVRWLGTSPDRLLLAADRVGLVAWQANKAGGAVVLLDVEHPVARQILQLRAWSVPVAAQLLLQYYLLTLPEPRRLEYGPRLSQAVLGQLA